jgi:hypothetical protein
MADADDDPTTNLGAAAGLRDLVTQVRAYAAAQDLLTDDVLAQIRAQLTNAPELNHEAQPAASTLGLHQKREVARLRNQTRENADLPPERVAAHWEGQRMRIRQVLARWDAPPEVRQMWEELALIRLAHQEGRISTGAAADAQLATILRSLAPSAAHDIEEDLLNPLLEIRAGLTRAGAGSWATLQAAMRPPPHADREPDTAAGDRQAYLAAAVDGMRLGSAAGGGIASHHQAYSAVRAAFVAAGVPCTDETVRKASQRMTKIGLALGARRPVDRWGPRAAAEHRLWEALMQTARHQFRVHAEHWPEPARVVWLATLARGAHRDLGAE